MTHIHVLCIFIVPWGPIWTVAIATAATSIATSPSPTCRKQSASAMGLDGCCLHARLQHAHSRHKECPSHWEQVVGKAL